MSLTIGIMGAGQLGAFLASACKDLGLRAAVLGDSAEDPGLWLADESIVGSMTTSSAVEALIERADIITFEKEAIPDCALQLLENAAAAGRVRVSPSPQVMRILRDKSAQKAWLSATGIPTLPHVQVQASDANDPAFVDRIRAELGSPFIFKYARGGYDGLGVRTIGQHDSLPQADGYAEPLLSQRRELAVLVARSIDGTMECYPVCEALFDTEAHVMRWVRSPAAVPKQIADRAIHMAESTVRALDGVGVFAVELFLSDGDKLWINEISPRVHNCGHLTIEASETSQFEQHLRAICGMRLGEVSSRPAAMANILAEPDIADTQCRWRSERIDNGAVVHWYGKKGYRSMRKIGHITATGTTPDDALQAVLRATPGRSGKAA